MGLSYEEGKLYEKLIDEMSLMKEMLKSIGDMVYSLQGGQVEPKRGKRKIKRRDEVDDDEENDESEEEYEEDEESEEDEEGERLSESERNNLEIITAEKEKSERIRNLTK